MVVDQSRKIFHESWYRIANQKIALRSSVRIHRQYYRAFYGMYYMNLLLVNFLDFEKMPMNLLSDCHSIKLLKKFGMNY